MKNSEIKQKINFQKRLDETIVKIQRAQKSKENFTKPTLLLHACCGPCSSYVLEYLSKYFQITVFYYNPNIYPEEEYQRRILELRKLYKVFPPALEGNVKIVEAEYLPQQFYDAVDVEHNLELAKEKEKGERCRRCYELRLKRSYDYAKKNHFDYFCTTLSISPFKDSQKINEIGENLALKGENELPLENKSFQEERFSQGSNFSLELAQSFEDASAEKPQWLYSDFKKKGGFKRSLEISAEYGMYRQNYCGCVFSKNNSEAHKESESTKS